MKNFTSSRRVHLSYLYLVFFCLSLSILNVSGQNCSVNAGIDDVICINEQLLLDGSYTEPLQTNADVVWTQVDGPAATIVDPLNLKTEVKNLVAGETYTFRISTTCGDGAFTFQDVTYTILEASIADAGDDAIYCPGDAATLSANAPETNETGQWTGGGNGISIDDINDPSSSLTINGGRSGSATLRWTISNDNGCNTFDEVTITNRGGVSPVSAGADQDLSYCYSSFQSTQLQGSYAGSGIDGQIGTWTIINGPNVPTINNPNANNTLVTNLIEGSYIFRWTVNGPCTSGYDEVTINVPAPTADITNASAGADQVFCDVSRTSTVLNGNSALYINENVLWEYLGTEPGITIVSPNSPVTQITGLSSPNSYSFRYTISNPTLGPGGCSSSDVTTVSYLPNPPALTIDSNDPIINDCGENTATIDFTAGGSGTSQFRILSGPASSGFSFPTDWTNAGASPLTITGLTVSGTYVVEMRRTTTTGIDCSTQFDQISVVISETTIASNPGTAQILNCNVTTTDLVGNDPGSLVGTWSQVSGPTEVVLTHTHSPVLTIEDLHPAAVYVFRWLISGGPYCETSQQDVTVITANNVPTAVGAGNDQTVCSNTPVYLDAEYPTYTFETGTWSVSPSDGVTFSDVNDPKAIVYGLDANKTYTFLWTISNGCGSSSNSITVDVSGEEGPIEANAGPDQCLSTGTTTIQLNGNDPVSGSGQWFKVSGPGTASFTDDTQYDTEASVTSDGTYQFEWVISTVLGCNPTRDTMEVKIDAPVTTPDAGANQEICGNEVTLTGNIPTIGTPQWTQISGNAGYTIQSPNSNSTLVTGLASGVYVFQYAISNGVCTSSDLVTIYVSEPPSTADAGDDKDLCGKSSTTMNAVTPADGTGLWSVISGPNTPNIFNQNSPTTSVSNLITGTYTLQWTVYGGIFCPSSSDTVIITVVREADAGADQSYCEEITAVNLTGTTASSGTWSQVSGPNTATIISTSGNTATASDLIPGVYEFEYEIAAAGCSTTDRMTVTLYEPPTNANAGIDFSDCDATSFSLNATPSTSGTGTWSVLSGPAGGSFDDVSNPNATFSNPGYGVYVFQWTIANGDCSNADQVRYTNFAPPSTANAGGDLDLTCATTVTMAANDPVVGVGEWTFISKSGDGPEPVITSTILYNTTITNLGPQTDKTPETYTFRWTISNGSECTPTSDEVNITVYETPTPANAGSDQELCEQSSVTLNAVPATTGSGTWTQISPSVTTESITNSSDPNTTVTSLVAGETYVFDWTTETSFCSSSDQVTVTNWEAPTVASASDITECLYETVNLTGNTPTVGTGVWTQTAGTTVIIDDPSSPTSAIYGLTAGTYSFKWTISNGSVCTPSEDEINVEILALPTIADAGNDQFLCDVANTTLEGNTATIGTGTWTFVSDGTGATITDVNNSQTTVTNLPVGTHRLRWTISNGCSDYFDEVNITRYPNLQITDPITTSTYCIGGTEALSVSASGGDGTGYSYQWYQSSSSGGPWSAISGATNATYNTPTSLSPGDYYYYAEVTNCTTAASSEAHITIVDDPVVTTDPVGADYCSPSTHSMSVAATGDAGAGTLSYQWQTRNGTTGAWTNISGATSTNYTTPELTASAPDSFTKQYRVRVVQTASGCETFSGAATVTIHPIPSVTSSASKTICNEDATDYSITSDVTGTTFVWTAALQSGTAIGFSDGTGSLIDQTLTNSTSSPAVVRYTITPTGPAPTNCVGSDFTLDVTVNPTPDVIASPSSERICNNTATNIALSTNITGTTVTYSWTASLISGSASGFSNNSGNSIQETLTNSGNTEAVVRYTITPSIGSCTGTPITVDITVNPSGQVNDVSDQVVCNNGSTSAINFSTSRTDGTTTYEWTNDNTSIGLNASGSGDILSFTAINSGTTPVTATVTVTPTYTNGSLSCEGPSKDFTITVNPTAQVDNPGTQILCNQASVSVNFTTDRTGGSTSYSWTNDNPSIGLGASGNGNLSFTATNTGTSPISANIEVTPTFSNGGENCSGPSETFTITVNPSGQVNTIGDQQLCNGSATSEVTFSTNRTPGTTTYEWTNDTPSIGLPGSGNGDIPSFTAVNNGTDLINATITITPYYEGCAGATEQFIYTVYPTPVVSSESEIIVCSGETLDYEITSETPGTTFNWTATNNVGTVSGFTPTGTSSTISDDLANAGAADGKVTYTIVPTANSCPGPEFKLEVTVLNCNPKIGVAKQLVNTSYNEDGTADVLFNIRVQNYGNVVLNSIQVVEDLATAFSGNYEVLELSSTSFDVNTSFDGNTDQNLLSNSGTTNVLAVGASTNINLKIKVLTAGSYSNQVTASSPSSGGTVDDSQNGSDPDDGSSTLSENGDEEPGNNNEPTPVEIGSCTLTANVTQNTTCGNAAGSVTLTGSSAGTVTLNGVEKASPATYSGLQAGWYSAYYTTDANGCIAVANFEITNSNSDLAGSVTAHTNVSCNGGNDGAVTVTPSGGTSPYSFELNGSSESDGTFTGLSAGEYGAKITDANGCIYTVSFDIDEPTLLVAQIVSSTNESCFDAADGTATVDVTGGTTPYSYLWSNGQTSATAVGLADGNYTVTVTDAGGCTVENLPVTIGGANAVLAVTGTTTDLTCNGDNSGAIDIAVTGGTAPYSYVWSNGLSTEDISNLPAGDYSVTVTDANGCNVSSETFSLTQPAAFSLTSSNIVNTECNASVGEVTIEEASGTAGTFTVNGVNVTGSSATFTNLPAGYYTATFVATGTGCTAETSFNIINSNSDLEASVTANTNVSCNGGNDGGVTVTPTGGTSPYSFELNGSSESDGTFSGLSAGEYGAKITDANGCTYTVSFDIDEPTQLVAQIVSSTNESCFDAADGTATVDVTGGTTPYSYLWSNGQTSATAVGLADGNYTVTITDAGGCTVEDILVTIGGANAVLAVTGITTDLTCNGDNSGAIDITVTGGTAPYSYVWSNGLSSEDISNLPAGDYSVTVTDANGCTVTSETFSLTQPAALSLTASNIVNTECNASVGEVTIEEASGTDGTFTINGVNVTGSSATFTNLPAGYYTATFVATSTGCTAETSFNIINSNSDLEASVTANTNVSCNGGNDGAVTVTPTGGTSPYSFELNGSSESDGTFTGLSAGEYGAKITDANGCTYTVSFDIDEPTLLVAQIVSSTNESCFDAADGTATVDVTGGTTPYSYLWSNGQTSATAVGLADGNYTVTVTDAGGCTVENLPVTIGGANAVLAVTGTTTDLTCNGDNSGAIDIAVTGGTAPYSYVWSNGLSSEDISNLPAGDYSVTVTDANGCNVSSETFSLTQPTALSLTASNIVNTECNASVGEVTIEEASATAGTFTVNGVNVTGTSATFTNLPAGYYTATFVATGTGCTAETSFNIINSNSDLEASVTAHTNVSCNGGNDGAVTVTPYGGTSPYSFELNGSSESDGTFTSLTAGEYGAKITDANGCTYTVSFDIDEPTLLVAQIVSSTNVSCNGGADGSATINATGGTPPYTYAWNDNNSQTTATATGLTADSYEVTVTDANGCTGTVGIIISEPANALVINIVNVENPSCYNANDGVIDITVDGGTAPYSYVWSNGQATQDATSLVEGDYSVTITDSLGCTTVGGPYNLSSPDIYTVSAGENIAICSNEIIALEGSSNANIIWTTSGTGSFDNATLLNAEYTPSEADISDGQVQLTLTTTAGGNCDNISDQMILTIWKQATAYAGIDAVSATGEPYQVLDATAANYSRVNWTHDGLGDLSGASTLSPVYTPGDSETGIISLILEALPEGGNVCSSAKDTVTISIGEEPEITVDKRTVQVILNNDGSTDITFEFNLENTGNVNLNDIDLIDDLSTTFPGTCNITVLSNTSDNFNVNENFDGIIDTQILDAGNTLDVLSKKAVLLTVRISGCDQSQTSFTNKAIAEGTSAGNVKVTDTDLSYISIEENPVIGLAKQLVSSIANGDGTYSLKFNIRIHNYGKVSLHDIAIEDDLDNVFGNGNYVVETITSEYFAVNENYNGGSGENLLADNNYLEPSETGAIQLSIKVLSAGSYSNQAEVLGISPRGTEVTDLSQAGTNPDPDSDGDPTNNNETTNIELKECTASLNLPDLSSYTRQVSAGECGYIVVGPEFDATTTGDCELVNLTHDYELWNSSSLAGAKLPVGTTTINWTAEFASGNTLHYQEIITVEDNEAPEFVNCPTDVTYTVALFANACQTGAIWSIPVANDNCSQVEVTQVEGPAQGDLLEVGLYTITYQAEDEAGNIEKCSFKINVIDTEAPLVVCLPNIIMDADAGTCSWKSPDGSLSPLLASSNCEAEVQWRVVEPDGTQTNGEDDVSGFEFDLGTSTVYYTITESASGQNWDCNFTVTVEDSEAPVIECQPSLAVPANTGECSAVVDLIAPTSTDNCSSDLDVFFKVFAPDNSITGEYNYERVNSYEFENGISKIEWKVVDKAGNQNSCWQNISVNPDSDMLVSYAGENAAICNTDVFTTNASVPGYANVMWTTNGTGTFANASQAITTYTPSQSDILNGSAILTITSSTDCSSSSDQMMLILSQPPQVDAGADQNICETELVQLNGVIISPTASVLWSTSGTGTFSNSSVLNPVYTPSAEDIEAGQVDLTFRGVSENTCSNHEDVLTVFINHLPVVSAGDDAWICQEESFQLSDASVEAAETIRWTTSGSGSFNDKTAENPVYTPSESDIANGSAVLTVTAITEGACSAVSDEMTLNISKASTVDAGENTHTCFNTEFVITGANASNYSTLVWTTTGLGTLIDAETLNPTYVPADDETGVITLTLTISSQPGCSTQTLTDSMELEILPPLIVDIGDDETIFSNTPVSLSAEVFNGTNSYFYQWEPASSVVDQNSNSTETIQLIGTTTFEVSVTDANTGCTASDAITVYVEDKAESILEFYRGFSPNGDGTNDTWTIKGIDKFPLNKVTIFNRWGDKVRELYNYNNTSVVWDGTNDEGKELADGTYYYIVNLQNVEEFTGWVHIRSNR